MGKHLSDLDGWIRVEETRLKGQAWTEEGGKEEYNPHRLNFTGAHGIHEQLESENSKPDLIPYNSGWTDGFRVKYTTVFYTCYENEMRGVSWFN